MLIPGAMQSGSFRTSSMPFSINDETSAASVGNGALVPGMLVPDVLASLPGSFASFLASIFDIANGVVPTLVYGDLSAPLLSTWDIRKDLRLESEFLRWDIDVMLCTLPEDS